MKQAILKELIKLQKYKHVDKSVYKRFIKRLNENRGLVKKESLSDHFCVFFLPYHKTSASVFLGHHIKADDWISPGGHIERSEHPLKTVKREYAEELRSIIKEEKIEIFDLSIKKIDNPLHNCKVHYDMWYLVHMKEKPDYRYIKKEYYNAKWLKLPEALNYIQKNPSYKAIVAKLQSFQWA